MPLEEKHDKLLDNYAFLSAANYAFHKKPGILDEAHDFSVEVQKKMFPSLLGVAHNVLKAISPGRAFKSVADQAVYAQQVENPLSNIELTWVSDRETCVRTKNCAILKRMEDVAKKAGLDVNPREMCEAEAKNRFKFNKRVWGGLHHGN